MEMRTVGQAAPQPSKRARTSRKQEEDEPRPKFTLGRRALTLGIASITAVTFPLAHKMLPGHPTAAILVGLIPLVPYAMNVVLFAVLFTIVIVLSLVAMIVMVI